MPDPALLSDRGQRMRAMLPPFLQDDPDYLGVIHAQARELDLIESLLDSIQSNLIPWLADDLLLPAWEATLRLTIDPAGQTTDQRRNTIISFLRKMVTDPTGQQWVAVVTLLIGPGWTYEEHVEGDLSSPPAGTIRVNLPFPSDTRPYDLATRLVEDNTPANTVIEFTSLPGFQLDESRLDVGTLD